MRALRKIHPALLVSLFTCVISACSTQHTTEPASPTSGSEGSHSTTPQPAGAANETPPPPPPSDPTDIYTVDAAMRDAMSSPLEFVGHIAWPGLFQVLACVYKNESVVVVDERCLPNRRDRATIHIFSPNEGHVVIWGRSGDGSPLLRMRPRDYESFGAVSYFVAPPEVQPRIGLDMSAVDVRHYQEAMVALGARRSRERQPQEPHCWYSNDRDLTCDRMDEATFAAAARPFVDEPQPEWLHLLQSLLDARAVPRDLDTSSPERIVEVGQVYGRVHGCDVLEGLEVAGNDEGIFSPMLWTGGNELLMVCAQQRGGREVARVARVEGLRMTWSKTFRGRRGDSCQAQSLLALPNGEFVVYTLCGSRADQARGHYHPRLIQFTRDGTIRWTWVGGPGEYASHRIQRLDDGSFRILGHINPQDRSGAVGWQATVSARGELVTRSVGGSHAYAAD